MTLTEVIVVAVLAVLVSAALMSFALYFAKLSKSTFSQLKFSRYTKKAIEEIAKRVRYAKRLEVQDSGTRLLCTDENDVTCAIYFSDDDDNPSTLVNNRLYYDPNTDDDGVDAIMIGCYISSVPSKPVFDYLDRTSAVEINFRVGDPRDDPGASFQRETGPGPQGVTVQTAVGPRNSYLD